jgi:hypothetical protein
MSKRSRPRWSRAFVDRQRIGLHKIGRAGDAAGVHRRIFKAINRAVDGLNRLAARNVPAGGNCELRPFAKKFGSCGRSFGWRSMSGKTSMGGLREIRPGRPAMPTTAAPAPRRSTRWRERSSASVRVLHDFDVRAADGFEQLAGFGFGKFRVVRADDEDEFVARPVQSASLPAADDAGAAAG